MRFALLGEVSALGDDGPVDIGHPRQRNVLAALLVDANRPVSAESLLYRVWGDRPPATARGTLFTYLTRLRQAVAPVPIERIPGGYRIAIEPEALDLNRFTALLGTARDTDDDTEAGRLYVRAFELWHGEPLPGLDTPWANEVRDRLTRQHFAAELDHTDVRLRLGEHATVLPELAAWAGAHPLDERLAGQLILALYRSGRLADALRHYQEFSARLAEELGADPGPPLRELHGRILAADRTVLAPAPANRVPRQLPAPPDSFSGRTKELAALSHRMGTVVISAIGGGGGIGKTSLALRWAHANVDRYPDGQLFVNLRGFDPSGRPPARVAALRGFLGALGIADVPSDVDAAAALYRSAVAGRKMVVLLDNAADTAQVSPLLPGTPTVTTLVTSRRPLTGLVAMHGAHAVPLDVLRDEEAQDLLAGRLGPARLAAEPAAVTELIAHCAGLPLALSIVAARALVAPDLPLSTLAEELRAARLDGLDTGEADLSLRSVLSLSHNALTPDAARLTGLLARAPGPDISLAAVQILAGGGAAALAELESAHLIAEPVPGRYRMHDLVRLDAAERAASLPEEPFRRLIDFYLSTAHAADRLLAPQRPPVQLSEPATPLPLGGEAEALAWLESEHLNLMAAQRFAAERGWHTRVTELALVTDTLHSRQGRWPDQIAMIQLAIAAAEAAGDLVVQSRLLANIGQVCARAGAPADSARYLEQAIALTERTGDKVMLGHCHTTLAITWGAQGDHERARHHAVRALELYRAAGEPGFEARALNQIGWVNALLGDFDAARSHCLAALALRDAYGVVGEVLDSLGYIEEHSGNLPEAVDWYRQAVAEFEQVGDTYNVATTMIQLGRTYAAQGSPGAARTVWQQALRLCEAQERTAEAAQLRDRLAELPR